MLRKRKKKLPRQIDKIIEALGDNKPVPIRKIKAGIALDMLDELQKLDGEAYIRSAAIVFDSLDYAFANS